VSEKELDAVAGGLKLTEVPPVERNAYFDGKLLKENDLEEEQKYPPSKPIG
jgi:hypothetical protein